MSRLKLIAAVALSLALVGGLVASLLSGGGTPKAQTAGSPSAQEFFGIIQGIRLDEQDFQTMEATGVGSNRFQLVWGVTQPSRESFNWAPTDALVGGFASHGIRPVPFVWGTARWVADPPANPPLDSADDVRAWQNFLTAAVARYGPGGSYWLSAYRHQYGAEATPLPVQSWQIWNEPNLEKYFAPEPSVERYARLLKISRDAIKRKDPRARIILAGMPGYGDINAWDFVDELYSTPGIKRNFDAAALHPYAPGLDELRREIERMRAMMKKHGDRDTPLWLTELGWGSGPPDRFGLNKGLDGQKELLSGAFKLILRHRKAWNVDRVFWFDWRDPDDNEAVRCSFCSTAGLLTYDRTPKPAYYAFKRLAKGR